MNKLKDILGTNQIIEKMYDIARIVDPVEKSVIIFADNEAGTEDLKCFDFWGDNKICDNCISMRAYNEDATFIKMEFNKDRVYLITAIPYELDKRRVIIELLKDVTENLMLSKDDFASTKNKEVRLLIGNMNKMAYQDPLTGLFNRRYISEKLPSDMLQASFSGSSVALLMCDLDSFKDINDQYGHLVGDAALKEFASLLQDVVTPLEGWAARFGGDEFLLCIPGTDLMKAVEAGERLRKASEDIKVKTESGVVAVTASIGIYIFKSGSDISSQEALRLADEKMYLAKHKGRNRVEY